MRYTDEQREHLRTIMDFDHVVRIHEDGTVSEPRDEYAPEVWQDYDIDEDGYAHCRMEPVILDKDWTLLTGHTGQYGYNGAVMHPSEYIGGGLADYILDNPGLYVSLIVELSFDEDEEVAEQDTLVGWAIARKD